MSERQPEDPELPKEVFIDSYNALAQEHHLNMVAKGFWDKERNVSESLMLIVTEIAEACEADRHGNPPDDKIPTFNGMEAELADAILRIMDLGQGLGLRVADALVVKLQFNKGRAMRHGKAY